MESWNVLMRTVVEAGGVGTAADARAAGVAESTWHRRTRDEGWRRPYRGVRVAPWASDGPMLELRSLLAACRGHGAAAGRTALWLAGAVDESKPLEVVLPQGLRAPRSNGRARIWQPRWLCPDDVVEADGLARLRPESAVVSLAPLPAPRLRGLVIDVVQQGLTTVDRMVDRLARVGPITGRQTLESILMDLGGRRPESWFHDTVLTRLLNAGYPVGTEPLKIETPDGRGVRSDIPITPFKVAVEPEGDSFHRSPQQRRADRRRTGQYAGTLWVPVPVDYRDWHVRQDWVLDTIDASILRQLNAGIGTPNQLPPHLCGRTG